VGGSRHVAVAAGLVVAVLAALSMGCGGGAPRNEPRELTVPGVGTAGRFDVGGRKLFVECHGSGSPTVVLEAGFGGNSRTWSAVLPDLGRATRTCAYDRAGLGASEAIPGVHDARDEIRDLERLLEAARIEPPYVVVGFSYGGLLARLFAHAHPDRTAGVVLVDANGRDDHRRALAAWPKSLAPGLRREFAEPVAAGVDVRASAELDRHIRSLGDTPLVVLTAATSRALYPFEPPARLYRLGQRLRRAWQAELADLSADHVHAVASRSDHFINQDQALVVVEAIRAVVAAVRDDAPLPPCERVFSDAAVRCLG